MAKLTQEQRQKAQSIKAVRGAERRLATPKKSKMEKEPSKTNKPTIGERTKGITNIIKKRAAQAGKVK